MAFAFGSVFLGSVPCLGFLLVLCWLLTISSLCFVFAALAHPMVRMRLLLDVLHHGPDDCLSFLFPSLLFWLPPPFPGVLSPRPWQWNVGV